MKSAPGAAGAGDGADRVAGGVPPSLAALPTDPGVYLFRSSAGEILYIGKARNLRRRVRSYFRTDRGLPFRIRALVERATKIEARVVRTEQEALVLEARLIQLHPPRYNRRLKEGRPYPFLKIIRTGVNPRVLLTRYPREDGAEYFGPCPEPGAVRAALDVIRRLYTLEAETFERGHAARLAADQARMAAELLELLHGRSQAVRKRVDEAMRTAANALDFERAARLREAWLTTAELAQAPRLWPGGAMQDLPEVVNRITVALSEVTGSTGARAAGPAADPLTPPSVRRRPAA